MQVRERESCDLRSTNQIMGLPCSSPTAGAVTSDTSDIRLTGLYHGDHKYESVRHLNFQLPDWNHVESTTITTRETVRQTDRSVHCQGEVHRSEWLGRSLSLSFLSLSLSLALTTRHICCSVSRLVAKDSCGTLKPPNSWLQAVYVVSLFLFLRLSFSKAEDGEATERPVLFPPERDTWLQTASLTHSPATRPVYCEVSHPSWRSLPSSSAAVVTRKLSGVVVAFIRVYLL